MSNTPQAKEKYLQLAKAIREQGWYEPATGRILFELSIHLILCLGGIALFLVVDHHGAKAAALLVSSMGALGISTNTHTSSHNATFSSTRLNRLFTYFGYPFFFGMSAHYWWHKHCIVHHPTPNLVGIDDDVDLMPLFAITEEERGHSQGWWKRFHGIQWLLIPFFIAFNELNVQVSGWRFLLPILRDPKRRRTAHWIDLGAILLHWAVWVFLPMLFFPPLSVLGFYVARMALMGYGMFMAFAPAHFPEEAIFSGPSQRSKDFILRQTVTTVNFRTGFLGRLLCSGVDFQIEHHLFPGLAHVHYPKMARLVEDFCNEHGYPYRSLGWAEGIWKSLLVFRKPKKIFATLEEMVG